MNRWSCRSRVWKALPFAAAMLMVLSLVVAREARAQSDRPEIWGEYGWQQVGDVTTISGAKLEIDSGEGFGAGLTVPMSGAGARDMMLELGWRHLDTHVNYRAGVTNVSLFDLAINHYQLGVLQEVPRGRTAPYGRFSMGMMQATPSTNVNDLWMFEIGLGLGVKADLGERLGIRLETNVDFPLSFSGGGIWCGNGGCVGGVSGTSYLIQGGFRGQLLLKL